MKAAELRSIIDSIFVGLAMRREVCSYLRKLDPSVYHFLLLVIYLLMQARILWVWTFSQSNHRVVRHRLSHFLSHITNRSRNCSFLLRRIREDDTPERRIFLIHFLRHPLIELFHLSNLLQMPNNGTLIDNKFSYNFSCNWMSISFDNCS